MKALFGGTFDPFHRGHLAAAKFVSDTLQVSVQIILCAQPPHRNAPEVNTEHRWNMLSLGVAHDPALIADDREIARGGPSYTVTTLEAEREIIGFDESLCWVLGYDSFLSLQSWHRWQDVLELANLVVLRRPGKYPEQSSTLAALGQARRVKDKTDTLPAAGAVLFIKDPTPEIAASDIRKKIGNGIAVDHLLENAVASYISKHKLYGGGS